MTGLQKWTASHQTFGTWGAIIRRTELLTDRECFRPDCPAPTIPAGTKAIAFHGTATGTSYYHPACAKALGIRPTTS